MNERAINKLYTTMLVFFFCLAVFIPFMLGVVEKDQIASQVEKRNLAVPPSMPKSIQEIKKFPQLFDTYYSDHFGLREELTKLYFKIIYEIDRDSRSSNVTAGKDGWLFLGTVKKGYTKFDDPMGDAINVNLYTEKELAEFAQSMMAVKTYLKNQGVEYLFVIAPNKHTIYFDKLPDYISKLNPQSATDQLVDYLHKHTDIVVVDLRQALLEWKKRQQVYYKSDTHWNQYGANVAQYEIMKAVAKLFPGKISPVLLDDSSFKVLKKGAGDLGNSAIMGNISEDNPQPVFEGTCTPIKEPADAQETQVYTMKCDDQQLDAVIFRDSFFSALRPYFARKFRRSTYIWSKLNRPALIKYLNREKPDIVIEEWIERTLPDVHRSGF